VWKKTFGGSGNDSFIGVISVNDGYIVAGYSMSMDGDLTGLNQDWSSGAILVKYDLNGSVVWKKIFGGSNDDFFENVISVDDGYVAVGYGCSTDGDLTGLNKGSDDAFIVKYDVNGDMVWKKNYGGSSYDYYYGITSVSDGYVAVGNSRSMDGDLTGLNKGGSDAILVKYDVNGNVVWKKNYGGSNSEDFKHIISVSDGYVVVGYSFSMDGDLTGLSKGNQDAIIVKYDLNYNIVWKKNYGGSNSDVFSSVISVSDGYVAVGGSRSIDGDLTELNKGYEDAIIVKYDLNGNVVWKKNYSGSNSDVFSNVTPVNDGYVAVGYSFSNDGYLTGLNKGGDDAIIFKLNQNGEINLP
jgi:hypothetical protein